MRPILKPLQGEALVFCFIGGEIFFRGATDEGELRLLPISRDMAESLRETFNDESRAACHAGDVVASARAVKLWIQLTWALDALDQWLLVCRGGRV